MKIRAMVNFKTYPEATGPKAVNLAKIIDKYGHGIIGVAPQPVDVAAVAASVECPVFGQHVDACAAGRSTGFITPYSLKQNGCVGTLLDHSEHALGKELLSETVDMCRKEHLSVVLCADDTKQMQAHTALKPDILVYEPPELIATGNSVSQSKPDVLTESVWIGKKAGIPVWCGAGISSAEDVLKAVELGAVGVLIASWIAANKMQEKAVKELADALKRI